MCYFIYIVSFECLQIFEEKLNFKSGPKIDANNLAYEKPTGNVKIFNEKVKFESGPKIDSKNTNRPKRAKSNNDKISANFKQSKV